jgi:hypothetical protein
MTHQTRIKLIYLIIKYKGLKCEMENKKLELKLRNLNGFFIIKK